MLYQQQKDKEERDNDEETVNMGKNSLVFFINGRKVMTVKLAHLYNSKQ